MRKSALLKQFKGFKNGDIVKAVVLKGKYQGEHIGKVAIVLLIVKMVIATALIVH